MIWLFLQPLLAAGPEPDALAAATAGWSTVETDHLRIHAPPTMSGEAREAYARQEEAAVVALLDWFGGTLGQKVELYAWADEAEAARVLGKPLAFANPAALVVHTSPTRSPGHELAHVVVGNRFPGRWSRFVGEGTAVAFDQTGRDLLAEAKVAVRDRRLSTSVREVWSSGTADEAMFYPVAGAFVARLIDRGGKERFLALLEDPSYEGASRLYGDELQGWIDQFQVEVGLSPNPTLAALRARAQARMAEDRRRLEPAVRAEIEALYGRGSMKTEVGRAAYAELVERFPGANRAGCALLYLARVATGAEREAKLRRAIAEYADSWYGDGTQVGSYARTLLALHLAHEGRWDEARTLAAEVAATEPDAVDHEGASLAAALRRAGLLR